MVFDTSPPSASAPGTAGPARSSRRVPRGRSSSAHAGAARGTPVRLGAPTEPSPLRPGGDVALARVEGDGLRALGVRDGDHVLVRRQRTAADGDLAVVADPSGRGALWRVHPDRDALLLCCDDGPPVARTGPWPEVRGIVVGVWRRAMPEADPA